MTHLQWAVYVFIRDHIGMHGVSPTYQEITDEIGLSSRSHAYKIVKRLSSLSYLKTTGTQERNIMLGDINGEQERQETQ